MLVRITWQETIRKTALVECEDEDNAFAVAFCGAEGGEVVSEIVTENEGYVNDSEEIIGIGDGVCIECGEVVEGDDVTLCDPCIEKALDELAWFDDFFRGEGEA